ncbi:hypothetical protein R3P38DRAFT_2816311 [Favolaschia claudopus]|uniref:Uncharacterized protein n=1 Tax=Favolaschia claudopus TaxID=2862362 RepID=A0AAV9YZ73_9AGAR
MVPRATNIYKPSGRLGPLPIGDSAVFTHEPFSVEITEHVFADIVLGDDWIAICRAAARGGGVVFAPYTYEEQFNKLPSVPSYDDAITPEALSHTPQGEPALQDESEALSPTPQGEPALQEKLELPARQDESMNNMSGTESLNKLSALQAESINKTTMLSSDLNSAAEMSVDQRNVGDPYVRLDLAEKRTVVQYFAVTRNASAKVLRQWVPRHQHMSRRTSDRQEKKSAVLRNDFATHECTNSCLVLKSEADQGGSRGKCSLSATELQKCALMLNLYSKGEKRKALHHGDEPLKKARISTNCSNLTVTKVTWKI